MLNPTNYNSIELIKAIHAKEDEIATIEKNLSKLNYDLQEMKKMNASIITIQWKDSILSCLEMDEKSPDFLSYFLKTPTFLSECVAWNNGVDVNRDIKNKVASTLSSMFSKREVGRINKNGKSYYGLPKYFNKDLITIKKEYANNLVLLAA